MSGTRNRIDFMDGTSAFLSDLEYRLVREALREYPCPATIEFESLGGSTVTARVDSVVALVQSTQESRDREALICKGYRQVDKNWGEDEDE